MIVVQKSPIKVIGEVANPENYSSDTYHKIDSSLIPIKEYTRDEYVDLNGVTIPATVYTGFIPDTDLKFVDGILVELTISEKANRDIILVNQQWSIIRSRRNELLTSTDYTQLVDTPFTNEVKLAYQDYRQALRDITINYVTPEEVIFPTKPS